MNALGELTWQPANHPPASACPCIAVRAFLRLVVRTAATEAEQLFFVSAAARGLRGYSSRKILWRGQLPPKEFVANPFSDGVMHSANCGRVFWQHNEVEEFP